MKLADFAEYDVSIVGRWTDYYGQRRYVGTLRSDVTIRLASFVATGEGFSYAKSGRLDSEAVDVDLLLQPIHRGEAFQVVLRMGDVLNTQGRVPESRGVQIPDRIDFRTGSLLDWATLDASAPVIKLLVLSAEDIKTRRNGIWGVKPRHLAGLPPPWVPVLTTTRHGHMVI